MVEGDHKTKIIKFCFCLVLGKVSLPAPVYMYSTYICKMCLSRISEPELERIVACMMKAAKLEVA